MRVHKLVLFSAISLILFASCKSAGKRNDNTVHDVDWNLTVRAVPSVGSLPRDVMDRFGAAIKELQSYIGADSVIQMSDTDVTCTFSNPDADSSELYGIVSRMNNGLPQDYRFFIFRDIIGDWTFGVSTDEDSFKAEIKSVVINVIDESGPVIGLDFYFNRTNGDAEEWARFTERNIGRRVLLEINGVAVMAPSVNTVMTGGACQITVYSADKVKQMLEL